MATEDKVSESSEEKMRTPKRNSNWPDIPADWIKLLATPLTILIAAATLFWSVYQFNAQQQSDSQKAVQQQQLTLQQEASNQQQVLDQQRQTTLDTYLDRMSDLLLTSHLASSKSGDQIRAIAEARTYTAVRNLDGPRKGTLVRFLSETNLINWPLPIISLLGADLSGAIFTYANLSGANLSGANLSNSNLSGAKLSSADLSGANLSGANFERAFFTGANLSGADLLRTDLLDVHLGGAVLSGAYVSWDTLSIPTGCGECSGGVPSLSNAVSGAILTHAHLYPNGLAGQDLRGAPLVGAYLHDIDLSRADLSKADLSKADLSGANLSGVNLSGATLEGAHNLTQQQLDQVNSCKNVLSLPPGLTCLVNVQSSG
jgi:uncharacterized protein YjbI with pentapeptide repeats